MGSTVIDLLRHGEPVGGRAFRGNRIDDPLSDLGWQQMRSARIEDMAWQQVIASPLARCRAFAEEVATGRQLPLTIEPDLREVGFGAWEGRTPKEIIRDSAGEYEAFYSDPVNNRPAGAEPLPEFHDRVIRTFNRLCKNFSDQHMLIVTHAGVMRAIVAHILQSPIASMYRLKIDYAGFCRIRIRDKNVRLEKFNV